MTSPSRATSQYLRTQVQSSSPVELVVMLYDQAVRSGAAARDATVRRDLPARRTAISRVMAIVAELQNTLDMERGGAVAQELDRLYDWITSRLIDATLKPDVQAIDEVQRVLETLQDAWTSLARQAPAPAGVEARP
jgi:flagellar protein FliS